MWQLLTSYSHIGIVVDKDSILKTSVEDSEAKTTLMMQSFDNFIKATKLSLTNWMWLSAVGFTNSLFYS